MDTERQNATVQVGARFRWPRLLAATAAICIVGLLAAGPTAYLPASAMRNLIALTALAVFLVIRLKRDATRRKRLWKLGLLALILWPWSCLFLGVTGWDAPLTRAPSNEVIDWAKRSAHPISRLDDYDRSDWEFLRDVIGDRRIVMLGESNHCVEEYSQAKFNMIRYLHEELGFDVLAFESYMLPAYLADLDLAATGSAESAASSIYSMWNTVTVKRLFTYIKNTKSSSSPMHIAGIDMKIKPDEEQRETAFIYGIIERDTALAGNYLRAQSRFGSDIYDRFQRGKIGSNDPLAIEFAAFYNSFPSELDGAYSRGALTGVSADDVNFAGQIARILAVQPFYSNANQVERLALRDSLMADNIEFLAEEMYRDEKIIVWAHNGHIARARSRAVLSDRAMFGIGRLADELLRIRWMGEYVDARYGDDLYVMGLQMASGRYKTIDGREQRVRPPHRDSVEYLLKSSTAPASFLDFTRTVEPVGAIWQGSPSKVLIEAYWYSIVPADQFDGVLVTTRATPPKT